MAITLKTNVSFPMSIVVSTETVKDFQETRNEARQIIASGKVLKGQTKYRVEMFASDMTDEQIFERIYREGIREFLKKDFINELQGNESRIRVGDVKVSFVPGQSVLSRSCDCNACFECRLARGGE